MNAHFFTDRGKVREHNEDSGGIYYNESDQLLAVIADGMGGHQAGDIASQTAVSMIKTNWKEINSISSPEEAEKWLQTTLQDVNLSIFQQAQDNKDLNGMGTTIVLVILTNEYATVAHIGDSRCYVKNNHGFLQVTDDHSLVNELVRTGQLSKEEAYGHPRKNVVLKALGTDQQITADVQTLSVEDGDILLLCSDGLTDKMKNEELAECIDHDQPLDEIGKKLIQTANDRGGEDNISLVLIKHQSATKVGETKC